MDDCDAMGALRRPPHPLLLGHSRVGNFIDATLSPGGREKQLAQYVAYYFPMNGTGYALAYVTFCAPGITLAGKPTAADPGRHYIVPEDIVHTAGSNSHRKLIKLRGISHVNLPECHYMTEVIERVKPKAD